MSWKTILVLMAAMLAACGNVIPDPDYCESNLDCPRDKLCDVEGTYGGAQNQCIPLGDCQASSDCISVAAPICVLDTQTCRQCQGDGECMDKDPSTPACVDGMCVTPACNISSDCPATAPICAGTECVLCTADAAGDAACAARDSSTPYCTAAGTCGACQSDSDCTTSENGPICNVDTGTCRACEANSECASGVCDKSSGQCAAAGSVLFVDGTNGDDANTCDSADSACKTIGAALALVDETRSYISIEPGVYLSVLSFGSQTVTLVGEGAIIQPAVSGEDNRPVITIADSAVVTFQGLQIQKASGTSNAHGIRCASISDPPALRLIGVTVTENANTGVNATQCSLTIERSLVTRNRGGGIFIQNSDFDITNTIIADNSDVSNTTFGGMKVDNDSPYSKQIFAFNTVARNKSPSSIPSGVQCITATPMTASSNIVYERFNTDPSISGTCEWAYSNIEDSGDIVLDSTNISMAPLFVDSANGDFHLEAGSPCEDVADPNTDITIDFDGDLRPQGDAPDIGADELTM